MRPLLLALALAALTVPPAAADHADWSGGCSHATVGTPVRSDLQAGATRYRGAMRLSIVFHSTTEVPVRADVTCLLFVNGELRAAYGPVSVLGAGVAAWPLDLALRYDDVVTGCEEIRYSNGEANTWCADCACVQIIPQPVLDLVDLVYQPLAPTVELAHDTACATTGDVHVAGDWLLDCPPWGE
jgi:hypothetical protein